MDQKTLIAGVITLTLSIILVGSILVPIVQDVQATAGAEVTYENGDDTSLRGDYYNEDVTIVISSPTDATSNADTTLTINGDSYDLLASGSQRPLAYADGLRIAVNNASVTSTVGTIRAVNESTSEFISSSIAFGRTLTVTYTEDTGEVVTELAATSDLTTVLSTYTFTTQSFFAWDTDGDYVYTAVDDFDDVYVTESLMESKTAGVFWYMNTTGVTVGDETIPYDVFVSVDGENIRPTSTTTYTLGASISVDGLSVVDGTTDIYSGGTPVLTVTFTETDTGTVAETLEVTPTESFVYSEAVGHESSGAAYSLYGVIPVIVIIAIVMMAAGMIYSKRD